MSGVGSGRPPAAQKILQSLRPPLSFATPSRPPFATPDEYHRFPTPAAATGPGATSGGVGAGDDPPDTIEEGLVLRTPVRRCWICFPVSGSAYSVWKPMLQVVLLVEFYVFCLLFIYMDLGLTTPVISRNA